MERERRRGRARRRGRRSGGAADSKSISLCPLRSSQEEHLKWRANLSQWQIKVLHWCYSEVCWVFSLHFTFFASHWRNVTAVETLKKYGGFISVFFPLTPKIAPVQPYDCTDTHMDTHTHTYAHTQWWAMCLANKITLAFITTLALEAAISGRTNTHTHTHIHAQERTVSGPALPLA